MILLGQIDDVEVDAVGANECGQLVGSQSFENPAKLSLRCWVVLLAQTDGS